VSDVRGLALNLHLILDIIKSQDALDVLDCSNSRVSSCLVNSRHSIAVESTAKRERLLVEKQHQAP
jgi:hypothetical protein